MTRLVALGALLSALVASTLAPASAAPAPAPTVPSSRAGTGLGISSYALDVVMTNDAVSYTHLTLPTILRV